MLVVFYIAKVLLCLLDFINCREHELPQWLPRYCSNAEHSLHWPELSLHLECSSQHATCLGACQLCQLHSEYCHCESLPLCTPSQPSSCIPVFSLPVACMFFINLLSILMLLFNAGIGSPGFSQLFCPGCYWPCLQNFEMILLPENWLKSAYMWKNILGLCSLLRLFFVKISVSIWG